MKLEHINASDAPTPGGSYSHGVVANGFLFTCGMGPVNPTTGKIVEGGVAEQTRQTLMNLQKVLDVKGAKFSDVVKVTAHLQDVNRDFAAYDAVYREFFSNPFPVRTTVGSDLINILVEIDFVVAL
jgi:reactive intermediate/imine deaminase